MSINLKDLRDWLNKFDDSFLEHSIISAENGPLIDDQFSYRLDKPIVSLDVNIETKEILLLTEQNTQLKNILFQHNKTGNLYIYQEDVINKTSNEDDEKVYVLYFSVDDPDKFYVREYKEFLEKFSIVSNTDPKL